MAPRDVRRMMSARVRSAVGTASTYLVKLIPAMIALPAR